MDCVEMSNDAFAKKCDTTIANAIKNDRDYFSRSFDSIIKRDGHVRHVVSSYRDTSGVDRPVSASEAPPGYYAISKQMVSIHVGNICRVCDFRGQCDGGKWRCMSYELENGLNREDKCSVIFRELPKGD